MANPRNNDSDLDDGALHLEEDDDVDDSTVSWRSRQAAAIAGTYGDRFGNAWAVSPLPREDTPLLLYLAPPERAWALEVKSAVLELADLWNAEYRHAPNASRRSFASSSSGSTSGTMDGSRSGASLAGLPCEEDLELLAHAASTMTDLDYVEYSMVGTPGDLEEALHRICAMQAFQEEYHLGTTNVEEGVALVTTLVTELFPGLVLSLDNTVTTDYYHLVLDFSKVFPRRLQSSLHDERIFMGAMYYLFQALQPHCKAMRNGHIFIVECDGMTWNNVHLPTQQKLFCQLRAVYPLQDREITWVRIPMVGKMLLSVLQPFMTREFRTKLKTITSFEGDHGRLDRVFVRGTPEQHQAKLIGNVRAFLTHRYWNRQSFRL